MNTLLKLEEIGKLGLAYFFSIYIGADWWLFWAWILAPDLSMIGYIFNPKIGAWIYNFFHHQAVAILVGITGYLLGNWELQFTGWLLFGHSAMDRAFGYGLKFEDDFKNTHLGKIGKH
jgi:Domain of unknown function (DUF4260)